MSKNKYQKHLKFLPAHITQSKPISCKVTDLEYSPFVHFFLLENELQKNGINYIDRH